MLLSHQNLTIADAGASRPGDLELFKMLLQPHFLFNSLNNLYALSIKRSEQTADAIAGLSMLLEKVVSIARRDYITLSEEVELIREYIKLEKIWLGETSFRIDFQVKGDLEDFQVPPLVLFTFVENCFKHGIRRSSGDGWLIIKVEVRNGALNFSTRNNIPATGNLESTNQKLSGLGVTAVKELLQSKCYGNYTLKHGRSENVYTVDLQVTNVNRLSA